MSVTIKAARESGRELLLLFNGPPSEVYPDLRMVSFTSPNEASDRKTEKKASTCKWLYMPLWTLKKLSVATDALGLDLDEDEIEAYFAHFGGVAPACFRMDRGVTEKDEAKLLDAIDSITNKGMLVNLLKSKTCNPERHRLLHFKVNPEQSVTSFTRVIASQ
jgi:hypothetical protein